jgi:hydrogenase expression/formation protein HypC
MCLAVPVEIVELLPDDMARVTIDGVGKIVSVALIDAPAPGDYVIVHVGYALARIDPEEARRTLRLLSELGSGEAGASP